MANLENEPLQAPPRWTRQRVLGSHSNEATYHLPRTVELRKLKRFPALWFLCMASRWMGMLGRCLPVMLAKRSQPSVLKYEVFSPSMTGRENA